MTMTFSDHKEATAKDCEHIAELIKGVAANVREGNMDAFERFWIAGGTEEGDSLLRSAQEVLLLRYFYRKDSCVDGQNEEEQREKC